MGFKNDLKEGTESTSLISLDTSFQRGPEGKSMDTFRYKAFLLCYHTSTSFQSNQSNQLYRKSQWSESMTSSHCIISLSSQNGFLTLTYILIYLRPRHITRWHVAVSLRCGPETLTGVISG